MIDFSLCASLNECELEKLRALESGLQSTADLADGDVFIDITTRDGAVVVAEYKPTFSASLYTEKVVGKAVLRENEPAVFYALENGVPIREYKATTQEGVTVRQDVVPISLGGEKPFAALILERDFSYRLNQDKKIKAIEAEREERSVTTVSGETVREINHRIKNNLQLVASLMRIDARRTDNAEVKLTLNNNINRVLTIASIHDILTSNETGQGVRVKKLLERLQAETIGLFGDRFDVTVSGGDCELDANKATALAVVVNELVTNSVKHGYDEGEKGRISIVILVGQGYLTVAVEDDGKGFGDSVKGYGLRLAESTVKDRLNGKLKIVSSDKGSRVVFDVPI